MAGHWPMKRQSSLLEHCYFYLVKITHGGLCTGIQDLRCINSTVIHPFTATYTAPSCLWDGCNSPKCSRSFTLRTVAAKLPKESTSRWVVSQCSVYLWGAVQRHWVAALYLQPTGHHWATPPGIPHWISIHSGFNMLDNLAIPNNHVSPSQAIS